MPNIDIASVLTVIGALFGGGVMGAIVKAFTEKKKVNAEANNTNIKSLLEIDQRMNERMASLEGRVANLEQENYKLKTEKLDLEKKAHKLETKILELETKNKELRAENDKLKIKLKNKEGKDG